MKYARIKRGSARLIGSGAKYILARIKRNSARLIGSGD